jgi:hypothetical protein
MPKSRTVSPAHADRVGVDHAHAPVRPGHAAPATQSAAIMPFPISPPARIGVPAAGHNRLR